MPKSSPLHTSLTTAALHFMERGRDLKVHKNLHRAVCSHLSRRAGTCGCTTCRVEKAKMDLPDEGDVFSRHLFKVTNGGGFPCKAVVGVVVCHDGGGTQLAEFVLWALQLHLHGLQLLVLAAIH